MPAFPARIRRPAALLLVGALAACSLDTQDPNEPQLAQQWVPEEATPPAGYVPTIDVQGGLGLVRLTGEFVRTCTAGTLRVTHVIEGSALTFRASFTPEGRCASEPPTRQFLRYYVYLTRVPVGTYQVRVIHENDDLVGETGVAQEQTITVF